MDYLITLPLLLIIVVHFQIVNLSRHKILRNSFCYFTAYIFLILQRPLEDLLFSLSLLFATKHSIQFNNKHSAKLVSLCFWMDRVFLYRRRLSQRATNRIFNLRGIIFSPLGSRWWCCWRWWCQTLYQLTHAKMLFYSGVGLILHWNSKTSTTLTHCQTPALPSNSTLFFFFILDFDLKIN